MKYIKKGTGKNLILLHGWGCSKEIYTDIINNFQDEFSVWALDLPGFGESKIERPMNIEDYTNKLKLFIEKNNIINPILLGHSFGGRIAIKYASKYYCEKLILVDSAGIKRLNLKVYKYKIIKKFLTFFKMENKLNRLRKKYSSTDYKNASPIMKETLKLAVTHDQRSDIKKITCETLLIWGENDQATKVKDCYTMDKILHDSGVVIFEDTGHFPFLEKKKRFIYVLSSFLRGGD